MARRPWNRGRATRKSQAGARASQKRAPASPTSSDDERDGDARKKVRWNNDAPHDDPSTDDDSERFQAGQTCLVVLSNRSRIGGAYFDASNGVLYLLEDTQDGAHYDLATQFLEQVNPDFVLTSTKADENLITVCRAFMEEKHGSWQVRPHREFAANKGKDKLYSLPMFADFAPESSTLASSDSGPSAARTTRSAGAYDFMRSRQRNAADPDMVRWQASIRISNFVEAERSPLCMACVSALLDYLHRTRAFGELDGEAPNFVNSIEIIRLDQFMQINMDALLSLQIFEEQNHASMHSDKTKEGLSLFGTLNYTSTRAGYALLRQWLLRPSLALDVIAARHNAIECFLRADNLSTCGAVRGHLKGVRSVPQMLLAMKRGRGEARDWETMCKFSFHAAMLADTLGDLLHADRVEVVQRLKHHLDTASFKEMGDDVNGTIDWEASSLHGRVCVRAHLDQQLDAYRDTFDGLDSLMNDVSAAIASEVPADVIPALNVVYFPHLGFLISVPLPEGWSGEEQMVGLHDWTYQFNTVNNVFFKSTKMHELDRHIGDIQTIIAERELEIVYALYERVIPCAPAVEAACGVMAELDCLLSLAQASLVHGYVRPTMTEDSVIAIRGGRHPLHEQVVDTFIPNDAFVVGGIGIGTDGLDQDEDTEIDGEAGVLDQDGRSVVVITGANACGKSVYLKQVALIQFMAQIGCFVPAESATLGLVDKMFTRVQARESISKVQSSFMLDLNQVSLALRNATPRSLVLLDEFGKGTRDTDGAGLLVGVLRHFLARGAECPKVISTTHFRDIFRADVVPSSLPLSFAHMRVMILHEEGSDAIVYLHQAAPGLSLESHAARCAAVYGLQSSVVRRAQHVTELAIRHEVGELLDERMAADEEQELRDAQAVLQRFAKWKLRTGEGNTMARLREVLGDLEPKG